MVVADGLAPNRNQTISNPHADLSMTVQLYTIHITQHTYCVTVTAHTVREKSADFLIVVAYRSIMKMVWQKKPTSKWQPHGYLTMDMSPNGRYWYHYSGTLSFTPLPRVWKWRLQTPDLVVICRPMWLEQCGGIPNWLAQQRPPRSTLYRAAPFTNSG